VLAIIASTIVLAGIPIGIYFLVALITNDPGGVFVPFLLPILAVIGASIISCILFTPMALILKWLSVKFEWHMLTPLILAFISFCLIAVFLTCFNVHPDFYSATYTAALIYVVFLSTGFVIYWLTLLWCEPILLFLYKKLKRNQSF
jgi:hypothetical protein